MTFPGPSTVSHVVVRLPKNTSMRPQNIQLDVRSATDKWKKIDLVQTRPKATLAPAETHKISHMFQRLPEDSSHVC